MRTSTIIAVVVVAIIVIAALAYLVSQASKPSPAATTTSATPTTTPTATSVPTTTTAQAGPTLTIGVTDKVTELDPAMAYDFFTWEIFYNTMSGLVMYKPGTTELIPALATSWEVKDNGTVWIFHLRHDAKFCDGTPVTAQNVVWSIERVMRINGDPAWLVTYFVKNVTALDNYTVMFVLKRPVAYFLALLATPPYFPVSPKYNPTQVDPDQTAGGAGPYCISKFVRDQVIILTANPYWYGPQPYYKTVIIRFYSDSSALRLALQSGEIDIAWRTLSPPDLQALRASGKYEVIEIPSMFIRYMVINTRMINNTLVREALAAAVCRSQIINVVFNGTMSPLYTMIPSGMWGAVPVFKQLYGDCNTTLAQQLLQKAGYSANNKLVIDLWYTPSHYGSTEQDIAALLKQQLEATGMIQVNIRSAEWSTYTDYARKGVMEVYLLGWYPDYLDPDDYMVPFFRTGANSWLGNGYSNPTVDALLDKASVLVNQTQRAQIYAEVQYIIAREAPIVPLFQGKLFIVAKPGIKIVVDPTMILRYWLISYSGQSS
ncbi:ABC transporter substrate-binding protein [Thermoproteus tenax]|uniref:Peptide ABC transporter, substrate binding protein n=2 Tax=Thermoproteus tenax TaxID=2271 RepID=G4RMC6_THETK|nr:ABC transporter substrate-binding protein [Thermoproteus tenax]CAP46814.1 peptide ABC transporter, substrate binding protein [Thermoproteus tenax Kra 1]CCC80757.1 Peptide ABC transporter, substrate binding protein [Thermoproteus tenax Kra 1]